MFRFDRGGEKEGPGEGIHEVKKTIYLMFRFERGGEKEGPGEGIHEVKKDHVFGV
jgi:hypothetical protein